MILVYIFAFITVFTAVESIAKTFVFRRERRRIEAVRDRLMAGVIDEP